MSDEKTIHASDCAVHNAPAFPPGPCDCKADDESIPVRQARQVCDDLRNGILPEPVEQALSG